ncbi:MAG: hypothetical protein ABI402_00040 [Ferruginibacter sp.]
MKRYLIFLLAICINSNSYCQKITIDGKEGNRLLQWDDFKGTPNEASGAFAHTQWRITSNFNTMSYKSDTAVLKGFEINLEFNAALSWVIKDKSNGALLKHEQAHFDIAIIWQREMIHAFNTIVFMKADAHAKISALFISMLDKCKAMQKQYDRETEYSDNKEQQEKWNQFIKDELARTAAL